MKVLLTGADGQLGQALITTVPPGVKLIATSRKHLDLSNQDACCRAVCSHRPDWVLNAGAYTAVDKAESQPDMAYAVNALAPKAFAETLQICGGKLLQISTDFVFNGRQGFPYLTDQERDPLGVYGSTKAAGEEAVQKLLGEDGRAFVLRTSWVIGPVGNNFARTMLRLHRERDQLQVVADQVGCPTSSLNLAQACWRAIELGSERFIPPVMHWSDAGAASWYDVAVAVGQFGLELDLLDSAAQVCPIDTSSYPTDAVRPAYSLLDCTSTRAALSLEAEHWQQALRNILQMVKKSQLK